MYRVHVGAEGVVKYVGMLHQPQTALGTSFARMYSNTLN